MGSYQQTKQAGPSKYLIGHFYVRPCDFVGRFGGGVPLAAKESKKVTRLYHFWDSRDKDNPAFAVTIYDSKQTSVYDSGLPSPIEFWSSQQYQCLNISVGWFDNDNHADQEDFVFDDIRYWVTHRINEYLKG